MNIQPIFAGKKSCPATHRRARQKRPAAFIVWGAFLLIVMVGMTGLVIDGGMMMATHRHANNAADAGAMAAAYDIFRGRTVDQAVATGTTYGSSNNDLSDASVVVNIPPASGPYAGDSHYAEAIVTAPLQSLFIRVLPGFSEGDVDARAVAGYENRPFALGIVTLDPNAGPGFKVSGNGEVTVNGGVYVNSAYGGLDENGNSVESSLGGLAVEVGNTQVHVDGDFNVVGGVDRPNNILPVESGGESPLHANSPPLPDPFAFLKPPSVATDSTNVSTTEFFDKVITGKSPVTLSPGVYHNGIKVQSEANVTFEPGIYILAGGGFELSGKGTITGNGAMFYNTGHDYNVNTGFPDINDGDGSPSNPTGSTFGPINFSGQGAWNFTPLNDSSSPYHGMLFYQRRANTQTINVSGQANFNAEGMIYAKWAKLNVSGNGFFKAAAVVGSFQDSGNGSSHIGNFGPSVPRVPEVFLVE